MSAGVGSYATTATVYGRNAADSYYNLSAPGLINGPLEVTGNLKVDGTTQLVGAVQMDGALSVAGGITASPGNVVVGSPTVAASITCYGNTSSNSMTSGPGGLVSNGPTVCNTTLSAGGAVSTLTSVSAGTAIICGSVAQPGGQFYGYNGSSVGAANFPSGMTSPAAVSALDSTKVQSGYGPAQSFNWLVNGVPVPINCASYIGGQTITVTVPTDLRTNLAYAGKQIVKFAMSTAAVNCTLIVTDGTVNYVNIAFSTNPVFYPLLYQVDLLQNAVVGGPNAVLSTGVQNGGGVYFTQN